ncbi:endonuclease/exonuclease/phosphatase family protein [Candidatus Dojkabacteria bacterium]|nr:endonuclease/exonuclease/phosphatase family protein [Candidatus Dojkabacteria bacterium]
MLIVDQPKVSDKKIETYAEVDTPKIKLLVFNTGGPGERDRQENIKRWEILANFVKQENIEVVMLQEQMYYSDTSKDNDIEYIKEVFDRIYPMYSVNLQFRKIEGNVILSKYPFVEGTYKTWQIKGNRFPQSIKINTPYGILRVVNIHTHNTEACKNSRDIFKPLLDNTNELYSPPNEDIIIAGDFNVVVKKKNGELVTESCRDMSYKLELDLLFKQVNADCVSNVCTNIWPERKDVYGFIDLGVTLKSSSLKILYTINNDTTKGIGDGHPPIVIEVTSPNWKFPVPTVATPTPLPILKNPTLKVMSYNIHHGDGKSPQEHREKVKAIVAYIKQNGIEVAGLQEVRPLEPDPDVADMFIEELNIIGYPMYMAQGPTANENYFKNIILSKYPILETQSFGQNPCNEEKCTRHIVMSRIQSPIGVIRFIDTHVHHGDDNCESIEQYNKLVSQFQNDPYTIMVGDYNSTLTSCSGSLGSTYSSSCEDTNQCRGGDIDWIFLTKQGTVLTQVYRKEDESIKVSDHDPIIGEIKSNIPIPTPTPEFKQGQCNGFNIYDGSNEYPDSIEGSQTTKVRKKLTDILTVRTASGGNLVKNQICYAPDGLTKNEYYQQKNWVCNDICSEGVSNTPGICDDKSKYSGHMTDSLGGYIDKFTTSEVKTKAKLNGLVFVTNIVDKRGGMCSTSLGYSESGVYFEAGTKFNEITGADKYDLTTECGVALEGVNCVRKVGIMVDNSIDLNNDNKISIEDFLKFVEYYRTSNCLIDFNKNNNCKDIEDFQMFVSGYKSSIG